MRALPLLLASAGGAHAGLLRAVVSELEASVTAGEKFRGGSTSEDVGAAAPEPLPPQCDDPTQECCGARTEPLFGPPVPTECAASLGCFNNTCGTGTYFRLAARYGSCVDCEVNRSGVFAGQWCDGVTVRNCPGGSYCPSPTTRVDCPKGHYCREGVDQPMKCKPLTRCKKGSEHQKPGAGMLFVLCFLWVFISGVFFAFKWYTARRQSRMREHIKLREKNNALFAAALGERCGVKVKPLMEGFTDDCEPVDIKFQGLSMHLKSNGKCILDNVTGEFEPGSMVAVMGPSGGGKSTMMSALLNRAPYGDISGTVTVCGKEGGLTARGQVGFVPQDDILHCDLTVHQNLMYSAMLRLPRTMPYEQKKKIVDDTLIVLGLSHVRDNVVGSPEKRGISGGQKKRVNIGVELVSYPRVLFLDEPTSGLDSAASVQVANCLAELGKLGITVITVIHQPRYQIFRTFSHCHLLAKGGKTAFLGTTAAIEEYFVSLGYRVPKGENVADWVIDIVTGTCPRYLPGGKVDNDAPCDPDEAADYLSQRWATRRRGSEGVWQRGGAGGAAPLAQISALRAMAHLSQQELRIELLRVAAEGVEVSNEDLDSVRLLISLWLSRAEQAVGQPAAQAPRRSSGELLDREMLAPVLSKAGEKVVLGQLVWFLRRSIEQVDLDQLTFNLILNLLATTLAAAVTDNSLAYEQLPMQHATPATLYGILICATMLPLFGAEKLTFRREASAGINVTMYWLARNLVNLVEIVLQAVVFSTVWNVFLAPDILWTRSFKCMFCYGFYLSGIAHLMSVLLGESSALLTACLIPAVLTGLYGGVVPPGSEMSHFQKFMSTFSGGKWMIENFVINTIDALPDNVQNLPTVQAMLHHFSYTMHRNGLHYSMLILWGGVTRALTLARLLWITHGCYTAHAKVIVLRKLGWPDADESDLTVEWAKNHLKRRAVERGLVEKLPEGLQKHFDIVP